MQPRPAVRHAAASSALGEELGPPFERGRGGPGGWILLDEPELHVWLVDPIARTLAVFAREADGWSLVGAWRDDAKVRAVPFDAIELELAIPWAR